MSASDINNNELEIRIIFPKTRLNSSTYLLSSIVSWNNNGEN